MVIMSISLKDADVVVLMDNDAAGYAHAEAVRGSLLHGPLSSVRPRWLDLKEHWPDIPKGGDVSDWLAVGGDHTPERLKALIEARPIVPAIGCRVIRIMRCQSADSPPAEPKPKANP